MKHLDEGTIHAWLDGALSEAEAKDVGQHAAMCAECSALVAEARGLIAGASRILTALDDVAAVAPKRAPVVASAKPQRFWQASPWVTGIAATLILAVGIKEWIDRPQAKAAFAPVHVAMDSLRAAPIPQPVQVDSAVRGREVRRLTPVNAAASGAGAGSSGLVEEKLVKRNEPAKKDAAADEVASAKVTAAPAAPVTPAPQAAAAPVAALRQDVALESAVLRDARALAGCYRLESVPPPLASQPVKQAAPTDRKAARLAAPAAAGAAAPSAAPDQPIVEIVRLDTAGANRIRVVTALNGAPIGTWTLEGDTVRALLRTGGMRSVPLSNRVACPVPPKE